MYIRGLSVQQILMEYFPDIYDQLKDYYMEQEKERNKIPEGLTKRQRETYQHYVIEGLTMKETGERMGISYSSVNTYIRRMREQGIKI